MTVSHSNLTQYERQELAALFEAEGPGKPTLCEGWSTQDLLIHLILRERRPDAAIGIMIPAFRGWREKVEKQLMSRPYSELVNLFAEGPGKLSPFSIPQIDNLANFFEFVIHHEDVRRAAPNWKPRSNVAELQHAVANRLPKFSLLALRSLPLGVVMVRSDGSQTWLKRGSTVIELHGEPIEILLYISGRQKNAQVQIQGSPAAIATFERTKFGF